MIDDMPHVPSRLQLPEVPPWRYACEPTPPEIILVLVAGILMCTSRYLWGLSWPAGPFVLGMIPLAAYKAFQVQSRAAEAYNQFVEHRTTAREAQQKMLERATSAGRKAWFPLLQHGYAQDRRGYYLLILNGGYVNMVNLPNDQVQCLYGPHRAVSFPSLSYTTCKRELSTGKADAVVEWGPAVIYDPTVPDERPFFSVNLLEQVRRLSENMVPGSVAAVGGEPTG